MMNESETPVLASYPIRQESIWGGRVLLAGALFALPLFALYLATLQRGVGWWDSGELIAAAKMLNVAHRPGFPLYVLGGHVVFGWLNDPRWLANAFSAACAAAALLFIWRGLWLLRGGGGWSAVWIGVGGWIVGLAPLFWRQAIRAEVYASTFALLGLAFLLCAAAQHAPTPRSAARRFLAAAYVAGLSFCVHSALAVCTWPVFVFMCVAGRFRPAPKQWLWGVCTALAGMSVYLYVPIRAPHAPFVWGDPSSFGGFLGYLSASDSFDAITAGAGGTLERVLDLFRILYANVDGIFAVAGVAGLVYGVFWRDGQSKAPLLLVLSGALAAATVVSHVISDNFDLQAYLFPVLWALWWGWVQLDPASWLSLGEIKSPIRTLMAFSIVLILVAGVASAYGLGARRVATMRLGLADSWGHALLNNTNERSLIVVQDANTDFLLRGICASKSNCPVVLNTSLSPAPWYRSWWTGRYAPGSAAESIGVTDSLAVLDWPRRVAAWWRETRGDVYVDYGVPGWQASELIPSGWLGCWQNDSAVETSIPRINAPVAAGDPDFVRTLVWFYYRLGYYYKDRGLPKVAALAWSEGLRWAPQEERLLTLRAEIDGDEQASSTQRMEVEHGAQ
jgi:hypothetical protein